MKLYQRSIDSTGNKKYIFLLNGNVVVEAAVFIHNALEHFCVPSQIGCPLGCRHCATTYAPIPYIGQLSFNDMIEMINYLLNDSQNLVPKVLSFAGHGEPMLNWRCVENTMKYYDKYFTSFHLTSVGIQKTMNEILIGSCRPIIYFSIHGSCDQERGILIDYTKNSMIANFNQIISFCSQYTFMGGKCIWNYMVHKGNFTEYSINKFVTVCQSIDFPLEIRFTKYNDINIHNKIEEIDISKIKETLLLFQSLLPANVKTRLSILEGDTTGVACGQLRANVLCEMEGHK